MGPLGGRGSFSNPIPDPISAGSIVLDFLIQQYLKVIGEIYDHMRVENVSLPICAKSGSSGTNLTIAITMLEKVEMLRKLKSMLSQLSRF